MSTITLRSVKNAPLSNTEVDNNFTNLNTDKLEKSGGTLSDGAVSNSAISGGTVNNTPIGGTTAAAGTFTTLHTTQAITTDSTVDGRDVAADGSKLDGIEAGADVTDTTNVTAAGALMDSELTNITAVKALNQGVATTDQPTWNGVDLAAISTSIADTAVDVFVYDTRKDSDGGAWRKRTQHTSWYNETLNTATRGSRREFPAVAVIVATSTSVTIYDGDDPAMPMWMVFNASAFVVATIASVQMLNGTIAVSSSANGVRVANFTEDVMGRYAAGTDYGEWSGGILSRNNTTGFTAKSSANIVNSTINDVAMTVLPNAPIDAATGLPVPTIAVATDGGVSVIKDDGTVVDWYYYTGYEYVGRVEFTEDYALLVNHTANAGGTWNNMLTRIEIPQVDSNGMSGVNAFLSSYYNVSGSKYLPALTTVPDYWKVANKAIAGSRGLTLTDPVPDNWLTGMYSYITSTYNTGWMNGDIKGAWLSDTDATNVTGSELVTNGTFDTDTDWTKGTGWSIAAGVATSNGTLTVLTQTITTVIGERYTYTFEVKTITAGYIRAYVTGESINYINPTTVGRYAFTFVATTTTTTLYLDANPGGFAGTIDNVSLRLADADRSVNNKGLQVFGTVTKSPVATGADLVAYSGFSASNYLQQPRGAFAALGTSDFCILGWVTHSGAANDVKFGVHAYDSDTTSHGFEFYINHVNQFFSVRKHGTTWDEYFTINSAPIVYGSFSFIAIVRASGVLYIYHNGKLAGSSTFTHDLDGATCFEVTSTDSAAKHALMRVSMTPPTAEQIAKIYEDEKVLFQDGAQATLAGTSDAVSALAYDDSTNLLHVGTSAGRSDFQGLRRVNNTTTAVGAAISASNGMIAED